MDYKATINIKIFCNATDCLENEVTLNKNKKYKYLRALNSTENEILY